MKNFKMIDFNIQVLTILVSIILVAAGRMEFYMAYFTVGILQLLSMLVHDVLGYFNSKGTTRRIYQNVSYLIAALMLLTPLIYVTGIIFLPMLFAAPVMAMYYLVMCYRETFIYLKRPLSILK